MITEDEKIRKAHEIYYRRNGMKYRSEDTVQSNGSIGKIFIMIILIGAIVIYQNPKEIFNQKWLEELKTILNTKINFNEIFKKEEAPKETPKVEETMQEIVPEPEVLETSQLKENNEIVPEYEIIWPYKGEITSGFGNRVSENQNLNGNHTGIDIAGNYGDDIVSGINGKVTAVSEEGDLGKHIKIENEKYTTIYAHCSEIEKAEGEEVKQGDIIAKIGSTGNSTGNHLHFEVITNGEHIDPITIIEKQVTE